jgi:methylthioribose-1-phosphate isomerase
MKIIIDGEIRNMPALWFAEDRIRFIDQRKLPHSLEFFDALTVEEAAYAIKDMVVRGAPAIGAAGAYGMALAAITGEDIHTSHEQLGATRPTAHDLFYAIDKLRDAILDGQDPVKVSQAYAEDVIDRCRRIGENGAHLIPEGGKVLTHCNAGALATVDHGTALAPMRAAHNAGTEFFVFVDETRPRIQGRLTAWELTQEGIPHRIIPDNAAGYFMKKGGKQGEVDIVITGADRITRNGDAANKIGTYEKAVLAKENGIPFYIAAPISTFDQTLSSGDDIEIEFRDEKEVLEFQGNPMFGEGETAWNPAFDVTPAKYIAGFITEIGVFAPDELEGFFEKEGF